MNAITNTARVRATLEKSGRSAILFAVKCFFFQCFDYDLLLSQPFAEFFVLGVLTDNLSALSAIF